MPGALDNRPVRPRPTELPFLRALVLARIAVRGGATRGTIRRDLGPLVAAALDDEAWRRKAADETEALIAAGLAKRTGKRIAATDAGIAEVDRWLGHQSARLPAWREQRDFRLVSKAVSGEEGNGSAHVAVSTFDSLRTIVVQKAFGLPLKSDQPLGRLRSQLAVVALGRAFGARLRSALGHGAGLSAKAGRLLAAQLLRKPRDFATDAPLVAALAADASHATQATDAALRLAVLQAFVQRALGGAREPAADEPPAVAERPNSEAFAGAVRKAAAEKAEGWPGSRKAFISRVWDVIRAGGTDWTLTEGEFKTMLAEAHRAGQIALATADLKDKRHQRDIEDSAVAYKNTVWHYVRVEG